MKFSRERVLDLLFPVVHCQICGERADSPYRGLCQNCLVELLAQVADKSFCPRCICFYSARYSRCPQCFGKTPRHYYHHGDAFLPYGEGAARFVKRLKYNNRRYLAETMAELITHFHNVAEDGDYTLIVSVPACEAKRRQRGYAQAALLADAMGRHTGLPVDNDVLAKVRDVTSQTTLTGRARRRNVLDAFAVAKPEAVQDKKVILVDDVVTTGATADECARVLRRAGAKRVKVVVFAAHNHQD